MAIFDSLALRFGRRLPSIQQTEAAECGIACLAMVAGYHGSHHDLREMRQRFNVSLKGITLKQLIEAAQQMGMATRPLKLGLADLPKLRTPCILHWDFKHFVVLKSVSRRGAVIHDPAHGIRKVGVETLSRSFTGVALELWPDAAFEKKEAKPNLRLLSAGGLPDARAAGITAKTVSGGLLVQSRDNGMVEDLELKVVTKRAPTAQELEDMKFAFKVGKHVKSNAVVYAKDGQTAGIGAGQMSRVDSARIAALKAAAKGYFGKSLDELTLAEYAILAGIPQSPTKFDLMRNAEEICLDEKVKEDDECQKIELRVPETAEIVVRRNYILDLMKSRSPLTGDKHRPAEYEAAKLEPVIIKPQVSASWRAPHFVWQVRKELAGILCPDSPDDCEKVDTGGYRVTTTLDWNMQKVTERYVYAAARAPHSNNARKVLQSRKIPRKHWSWMLNLRGRNIHNAAAAVIDSTGRLQLPPAVLELFPSRRVVVETVGDEVRLRRPEETP